MDRTGCPSVALLDRLLSDDLPAGERDRVSVHLNDCPRCQESVEGLLTDGSVLTLRRTTSAHTDPGPPADLLTSLRLLVPLVAGSSVALAVADASPTPGEDLPPPEPEPCPEWVGGYEVLGVLGRGGMSVVYKARQPGLGRTVALKRLAPLSPSSMGATRFLREAAAVARMHHPNIVQVFEVGEAGGRPFLALEYIPGGTLADHLKGAPVHPRVAAELLEAVAGAVHHAHEQGIVHRDLKPSNILLQRSEVRSQKSESDGPASSDLCHLTSDLCPKVSDFGLARGVVEDQSLTLPGVVVGTPAYVAPEVIRSPQNPAPAADVYALGVILYEMLTGRPPFVGPTALATLRLVESADPVPPTRLQPTLPRDIETICLACLRKDPRRRYASALALADDLRRFLDGRPIRARRVGRLETGWLWCRRNPVTASLGAALAGSVVVGLGTTLVLLDRAHRSAADAIASAETAGRNEARAVASAAAADASARLANDRAYSSDLQYATEMWAGRQYQVLLDLLDGQRPDRTDGTDRRGFEWNFLRALARPPHRTAPIPDQGKGLAVGAGGRFLAVAMGEAGVVLLDSHGKALRTLTGGKVVRVCVSADGRRVAATSEDGTARVWDADTGRLLHTRTGHRGPAVGVAFHPDGEQLVTTGVDGTVRVWNLENGEAEPRVLARGGGRLLAAAYSPDGACVAVGGSGGGIRVWDAATWVERPALRGHTGDVTSLTFTADSARLASGSLDQTARVWDVATGRPVRTLFPHRDAVTAVAFSPDGRSLGTASVDRSAAVTDLGTGLTSHILLGHTNMVVGVGFSPDGKTLASTGWDKTVRLWDIAAPNPFLRWRGHTRPIRTVAFSPDGGLLATGSADGTVRLWDPGTGTQRTALGEHTGGVLGLAFDPSGRLATAAGDNRVRVWDAGTGQVLRTLTGHAERINDVRFSPDGRLLAGAGHGGTVYAWEESAGWGCRVVAKLPAAVACVAFNPTGSWLAAGCQNGTVTILDPTTGQPRHTLGGQADEVTALDFRPDGRRLAVAYADRVALVWDADTGTQVHALRGHMWKVTAVRYSPDGRRVFTGSQDSTVRVWHADTGQPLVRLAESDEVTALAVSPDGRAVASAGPGGIVGVRRATPDPEPPAPGR